MGINYLHLIFSLACLLFFSAANTFGDDSTSMYHISTNSTFSVVNPIDIPANTDAVLLGAFDPQTDDSWCELRPPAPSDQARRLSTANFLTVTCRPERENFHYEFNIVKDAYGYAISKDVMTTKAISLDTKTKSQQGGWIVRCNNVVEKYHWSNSAGVTAKKSYSNGEPSVEQMEEGLKSFLAYKPADPIIDGPLTPPTASDTLTGCSEKCAIDPYDSLEGYPNTYTYRLFEITSGKLSSQLVARGSYETCEDRRKTDWRCNSSPVLEEIEKTVQIGKQCRGNLSDGFRFEVLTLEKGYFSFKTYPFETLSECEEARKAFPMKKE